MGSNKDKKIKHHGKQPPVLWNYVYRSVQNRKASAAIRKRNNPDLNLSLENFYRDPATSDWQTKVGGELNREQRVAALREYLSNHPDLNENEKQIAPFYYFDGMKLREIAEIFDKPLGTIKTTTFSLKTKLKKTMFLRNSLWAKKIA
jgi:DNA-directed RNA polymerase specialized sigma24 family protein